MEAGAVAVEKFAPAARLVVRLDQLERGIAEFEEGQLAARASDGSPRYSAWVSLCACRDAGLGHRHVEEPGAPRLGLLDIVGDEGRAGRSPCRRSCLASFHPSMLPSSGGLLRAAPEGAAPVGSGRRQLAAPRRPRHRPPGSRPSPGPRSWPDRSSSDRTRPRSPLNQSASAVLLRILALPGRVLEGVEHDLVALVEIGRSARRGRPGSSPSSPRTRPRSPDRRRPRRTSSGPR